MTILLAGNAYAGKPDLPEGDYTAPASVETATFIGSKGTEWLATGVFLSDGRILLAGSSHDPELELFGKQAKVVGKDGRPFPVVDQWLPLGSVETGKIARPKLGSVDDTLEGDLDLGGLGDGLMTEEEIAAEKRRKEEEAKLIQAIPRNMKFSLADDEDVETKEMYRRCTWLDREATAFWGVFGPDLKTMDDLWRLPRGAGSVTSAGVAKDGAVYICGGASERIEDAASDVKHLPAIRQGVKPPPVYMQPLVYIAKLSPDFSKVLWVRTMPNEQLAPRLRVLHEGDVVVTSPDIRRFSPEGELELARELSRARYIDSVSINPVTGGWCKGGDFLTKTGREPWRTPYFFIYQPDGTCYLELWRWRGPFAAIDGLGHLVADAQVAKTCYDDFGRLTVTSRSHGGNCVQIRYPYDIERMMPNPLGALPMNSPGCIVKLGTDYNVVGSGVFSDPGFHESVNHCVDGGVAIVIRGRCKPVEGLCELDTGTVLSILSPDLTTRRFASVVPGAGRRILIAGDSRAEGYGAVTGMSQGRPKFLFLSGAISRQSIGGQAYATPLKNPVQSRFAGGRLDGYAILMDLSPGPQKTAPPTPEIPTANKKVHAGDAPTVPEEGQRFDMGHERYATVHIVIREEAPEKLWPRFYYGGAEPGGGFTYKTDGPSPASFTLRADNLEQHDHSQELRVLGSRLAMKEIPHPERPDRTQKVPDPAVSFEVTEMGPWKLTEHREERRSDIRLTRRPVTTVSGVLRIGEKETPVKDTVCQGRFQIPRKVDAKRPGVWPNLAILRIDFTLTGRELGFDDPEVADKRYRIGFSCTGSTDIVYDEFKPYEPPPLPKTGLHAPGGDKELDNLKLEP